MDKQKVAELLEKALELPLDSGVYFMRDKSGDIIYIGKAKHLKNRVVSYFRNVYHHPTKTYKQVENTHSFDVIVTVNEFEALVLECSLIKQHQPKYNILLKDDKGYSYLRISGEDYPRITEAKKQLSDGARYIGPYMSTYVVNETLDEAVRTYMLPTCTRKFPAEFGKGRPCLNYHMKQCIGLCRGEISVSEYAEMVEEAVRFLEGDSRDIVENLQERMQKASEEMEFEKAARFRDRINAISKMKERQRVVYTNVTDQDVISLVQSPTQAAVTVMSYRSGRLIDKKDFLIGDVTSLPDARGEFISRYYSSYDNTPPKTLTVDGEVTDHTLIEKLLSDTSGRKVTINVPKRGESVKLSEMATLNAAQFLSGMTRRSGRETAALDELARLLSLDKPPHTIEAYDISNIGQETVVGGMVVFTDGRPSSRNYKRFKIKSFTGVDDYGAMAEVLRRRLARYKEGDEHFSPLPDLILIDGGKGHLSTAKSVLLEFGYDIPTFGMVKDGRHRTRAIEADGGEISITASRLAFTLLSNIQNEVHRYAISYAKDRHSKNNLELSLTKIPTIGASRAKALYKHFKTKKAIEAATVEELLEVKGMTKLSAQAIVTWFREQS